MGGHICVQGLSVLRTRVCGQGLLKACVREYRCELREICVGKFLK